MIAYAAAGDTWGIPGSTFLQIFIGAAVVIVIGALMHRRAIFSGPRDVRLTELTPEQAAYLNGGERLAVYTSLGALRTAGGVSTGSDHTLAQTGPMPAGVTPLDQAVFNAAGNRVRPRALTQDQWVRAALDQLRERLERSGLLLTPEARHAARYGPLLLLALCAVGVARLVAGVSNDRPVGFLVLTLLALGTVTLVMFARTPRRTNAANRALTQLRQRHLHLNPRHHPSYATYGVTGAAMGVALFGAGSLWAMDPAFAAAAEVERQALLSGGGWSSSSSWGGSSSGGSCGSGGSSCSSGGGSSCGGGGGGCGG